MIILLASKVFSSRKYLLIGFVFVTKCAILSTCLYRTPFCPHVSIGLNSVHMFVSDSRLTYASDSLENLEEMFFDTICMMIFKSARTLVCVSRLVCVTHTDRFKCSIHTCVLPVRATHKCVIEHLNLLIKNASELLENLEERLLLSMKR